MKHLIFSLIVAAASYIFLVSSDAQVTLPDQLRFTVTTTEDAHDQAPGDGRCHIGHSWRFFRGTCSLRAAIEEANRQDGAQTIILPDGIYELDLGQLVVTQNLTLKGAGSTSTTIDGNGKSRIFVITPPSPSITADPTIVVNVNLHGVTIRNGKETFYPTGGILIFQQASLSLNNCVVSDNFGNQYGGGIGNAGSLKVVNSTISANRVPEGSGGGVTASGGGIYIYSSGTTEIIASTLTGNKATRGGGIYNAGTLWIKNSTITGNTAQTYGGGILNRATTLISFSTITGNRAALAGTGLSEPTVGGGIYNSAVVDLMGLGGTILAGNEDQSPASNSSADCFSTHPIVTAGTNLFGTYNTNICPIKLQRPGDPLDLKGIDPFLEPLASNGGPTQTHQLKVAPRSPAIDNGKQPSGPAFFDCPSKDQIGNTRPRDWDNNGTAECDIGSVER